LAALERILGIEPSKAQLGRLPPHQEDTRKWSSLFTPLQRAGAFGTTGAHVRNRTEPPSIPMRCTTIVLHGQTHRGTTPPRCYREPLSKPLPSRVSRPVLPWTCSVTLRESLLARQARRLRHKPRSVECERLGRTRTTSRMPRNRTSSRGFGIRLATMARTL